MTPGQARAARAFLNLDMKTVCEQAPVGKRTLTEFEQGSRNISNTTLARLKSYYTVQGVVFEYADNGDGIMRLHKYDQRNSGHDLNVKPKLEYNDRFGLNEFAIEFSILESHVSKCQASLTFSRDIIYLVMSNSKLNQKQIASELKCSPAFISAVMLQKKLLSVELAAFLQDRYAIDGLQEVVVAEKKMKKLLADVKKIVESLNSEIDYIKESSAIA